MAFTYPSSLAGLPLDANLRARVDEVTSRLGDGVLERDALGGVPDVEIVALRDAGLLVGPWAQMTSHSLRQWDQTLAAISELASVDPSAAALLGYHHMHLLLLMDSGNPDIVDWAARETAANGWVWGGANNPSGAKLTVEKTAGGYLLNGAKEFATVSLIADQLIIQEAAPTDTSPLRRIVFAVDAKTSGLSVLDDWDGIGVIRSATNGISFKDVFVPDSRFVKYSRAETGSPSAAEAASAPGFQIMFANIYLGIALGAVRRAYHLVTGENTGISARRKTLSQVQEILGELVVKLTATTAVVAEVNRHFSDIVSGGGKASEETYRFLCGKVFPAKLFAHETVLDVTQRVFEVTGSRGATRQTGLEKLWRDARNHSLHDELRVRYRIVGAGVLELDPA